MKSLDWFYIRLKKDYLFPPRHTAYRHILETATEGGYRVMSLLEFYLNREALAGEKILVLRHDIDVDVIKGVRLFFDLEKEFGVSASYYFRLQTFTMTDIIHEILAYGSEVGYHFEEPATLAKQYKVSSCQDLKNESMQQKIDAMLIANIDRLNTTFGIKIKSICSHNDFYNRRLGVENHAFLSDTVRRRCNLLFEAYDPVILSHFDACPYDVSPDKYLWSDNYSPVDAMRDGATKIYALTHPRQWHPNFLINMRENSVRLFQEMYYRSQGL